MRSKTFWCVLLPLLFGCSTCGKNDSTNQGDGAEVPASQKFERAAKLAKRLGIGGDGSFQYAGERPSISPDGKQIAISRFGPTGCDIVLFSVATAEVKPFVTSDQQLGYPYFSPTGDSLLFAEWEATFKQSCIHETTLSGERRVLGDAESLSTMPSFSKDGDWIVFAKAGRRREYSLGGTTMDDYDIWMMKSNGTNPVKLTNQRYAGVSPPYFFPQGGRVIYSARTKDADQRIFTVFVPRPGEAPAVPKEWPLPKVPNQSLRFDDVQPSISPDGLKVTFISSRVSRPSPFDYEVWIADADAANPRQLTHNKSYNTFPVFDPLQTGVYYLRNMQREGRSDLMFISVDGSHQRTVADAQHIGFPR